MDKSGNLKWKMDPLPPRSPAPIDDVTMEQLAREGRELRREAEAVIAPMKVLNAEDLKICSR